MRKSVRFVIFGTAILVGLIWHDFECPAPLAEVDTPIGKLLLMKVGEGRVTYAVGDPVPRWLRKYVPKVNSIVAPRMNFHFDPNDFSFGIYRGDRGPWFVLDDAAPETFHNPGFYLDRMEFVTGDHTYVSKPIFSMGGIAIFRAEAVPRRERQLNIRLIPSKGVSALRYPIELTIENPFYRADFPEWKPGPLPARVTRGDYTVELTDITRSEDGRCSPVIKVSHPDGATTLTSITGTLEDATGNRGAYISPHEPVWKVIATLRMSVDSKSPLNKHFPLGKLTIPPLNTVQAWSHTFQNPDDNMRIQAIVGPGQYQLRKGKWSQAPGAKGNEIVEGPALVGVPINNRRTMRLWGVSTSGGNNSSEVLCVVSDGRYQTLRGGGFESTVNESGFHFPLETYAPGDSVDIEQVIQNSETFEFFVTPPAKLREPILPEPTNPLLIPASD